MSKITGLTAPAFLVTNDTTDFNVTGNSTIYTMLFDTEQFDLNGDFDIGTGKFTAPVGGTYRFSWDILTSGYVAATSGVMILTSTFKNFRMSEFAQPSVVETIRAFSGTQLISMNIGDECYLRLQIIGESSDIIDINGGSGRSSFCGELIIAD